MPPGIPALSPVIEATEESVATIGRMTVAILTLSLLGACGVRAPRSACGGDSCATIPVRDAATAALMALDIEGLCASACDSLVLDPRIRVQAEFNTATLSSLDVLDSLPAVESVERRWGRRVGFAAFVTGHTRRLAVAVSIVESARATGSRRIILTVSRPDGVVEVLGYRIVRGHRGLRAELQYRGQT